MILEELVARLGFQVTGENELRRAGQALDQARAKIRDFSNTANRELTKADKGLGGVTKSATATAGASSRLAGAFALVGRAALVLSAGGGVLALVASRIALIGANAAQARRQLQLMAGGMGTTAARSDQLTNMLSSVMGADVKDAVKTAEPFLKKLADLRDEAIRGDEKARETFVTGGLNKSVTDAQGMPRDTALIALDVIQRFKALQDRIAQAQAKGNPKAVEKANADLLTFRESFGIPAPLAAALAAKTLQEIEKALADSNKRNPTQTPAQEARDKALAEQAAALDQNLTALKNGFMDLAKALGETVLPSIVSFTNALVAVGKRFGLINKTQEEVEAETERAQRAEQNRRGMEALKGRTPDQMRRDTIDMAPDKLEALRRSRQMRDEVGQSQRFPPMPAPVAPRSDAETIWQKIKGWVTSNPGVSATPESIAQAGMSGINRDISMQVEQADNRKFENIGNDQRQVSVTVNATVQGMTGLGTSVQGAVAGALVKGSNASTDVITAP